MKRKLKDLWHTLLLLLAVAGISFLIGGCIKIKHDRFKRMYPNATTLDFIIK